MFLAIKQSWHMSPLGLAREAQDRMVARTLNDVIPCVLQVPTAV